MKPTPGQPATPATPATSAQPWQRSTTAPPQAASLSLDEAVAPSTASPAQAVPQSPQVREWKAKLEGVDAAIAELNRRKKAVSGRTASTDTQKGHQARVLEQLRFETQLLLDLSSFYSTNITDAAEAEKFELLAAGIGNGNGS